MASGNHYYQTSPISVDAYLAYHAGWVEAINIDAASHYRGSARVDSGSAYQYLNPGNAGEYFMINNRTKVGWESSSGLPDMGLMIMHCDENGNHNWQEMSDTNHFELSIEQADGLFQLEYDIHDGGADSFTDSTLPNAHWWANATTNPASGDASGLNIHDISVVGETMTFIVGSGAVVGSAEVGVDRSSLTARAFQGASPSSTKVSVWNKGGGTLSYTNFTSTPWISLSPSSGTASTECDVLTISYSTAGLGSGVHYGQVKVENLADAGDVRTVDVELTIEESPLLAASPVSISVTGAVGNLSEEVMLVVDNAGGGELAYSFSGPAWLSAPLTNGSVSGEADAFNLAFDGSGLTEGDYMGSLTIISADATNSPVVIPLSFVVRDLILTAPLSGDYANSDSVTIEWESSVAAYSYVDIELWKNGKQKVVIADDTPNDGHFIWTVPAALPSASNYTIRVSGEGSATYKETGPVGVWRYQASFEDGFDGWVNRSDDDFDWDRNSGGTGSSGTGPSGASDGVYYIYMEASDPNYPEKTAIISNRFDFSAYSNAELKFDYHMYGANSGSLHLDIFDGTSWYQDVWAITGQQHTASDDPWNTVTIDMSSYVSNAAVDLQFWGITDWWNGDMAVDNVRISDYDESLLTNNLPASWLVGYGLTGDNATALLDSDGDGIPNWAEYIAGTSPTNASSVLRMTEVEKGAGGLIITWSGVYGKTYGLVGKTALDFGSWGSEATGIPGVEPLCTHTVTTDNATGFIRVEIEE
jgi:hypothetical protein